MSREKESRPKRLSESEKYGKQARIKSEKADSLAKRIRHCADLVGSGDALAQKAAIPRRTLETYLSGEAEPKASRLVSIARAAGINLEWLATGDGPMRVGEGAVVAPLDRELLCLVIEEIEQLLNDVNGELEPEKKAELIALIYEEVREQEGKVDRARVLRLIKLAS